VTPPGSALCRHIRCIVRDSWKKTTALTSAIEVRTPERSFDVLVNGLAAVSGS